MNPPLLADVVCVPPRLAGTIEEANETAKRIEHAINVGFGWTIVALLLILVAVLAVGAVLYMKAPDTIVIAHPEIRSQGGK